MHQRRSKKSVKGGGNRLRKKAGRGDVGDGKAADESDLPAKLGVGGRVLSAGKIDKKG